MKRQNRYRPYEERFIFFSNIVEKLLIRLLVIFSLLLVLSQFLLNIEGFREILVPVEKLEGSTDRVYIQFF